LSQVLDRGAQAVARGSARCLSQVLDRGAQAVARGAVHCAPQVLGRGAQAAARDAATLPQQKKSNSADVQQNRVNITCFIYTEASKPSRRCTFEEFESLAAAPRRARHHWRIFDSLLYSLRLRHKTSAWAFSGPVGGGCVALCFGRWHALSLRGPPSRRTAQRPH
jgi:hypothetical protein